MSIKQEILLLVEEEEINTPEKLKTAILHGRVPGVKSNDYIKFYDKDFSSFINKCKDFSSTYRNAAIKFLIKNYLYSKKYNYFNATDAMLAYFNNRNKKEAKTTYKQLFTDFEDGKIDPHDFEKKVNELFKEKTVGKDESTKLYEDDTWLVVIPKSFAASCKYGENTKWCTTSSKQMFERYSKKSPLIIIINKKQGSNPLAKVQLNKETESYMDAEDKEIELTDYLDKLPVKIQETLKKQGFYKWNYVLVDAVRNNELNEVKKALDNGADIHIKDDFALRYASNFGYTEIVKLLLNKGADVHAGEDFALKFASENGYTKIVKLLLDKGADVHAGNDGALRYASEDGHIEIVKLLLNKGANIHANDDVALRRASSRGHVETVKLLLNKGANIHANDDYALKIASENGYNEVVKLLKQYMKKEKK